MNHVVDVRRPIPGDVIELILEDHRPFEEPLRNASSARAAVPDAPATVLVAHVRAEERFVHPKLRRPSAVGSIDDNCGTLTNVRSLVARCRREGRLD